MRLRLPDPPQPLRIGTPRAPSTTQQPVILERLRAPSRAWPFGLLTCVTPPVLSSSHLTRQLRVTFTNTGPLKSSFAGGVCECRGRLAADDRRGLVDELIVLEGLHHEQGKVHAARDVALENGVAH